MLKDGNIMRVHTVNAVLGFLVVVSLNLVGMGLQFKSRRKAMLERTNLCAPWLVSECNDEAIKVVLEV